LHPPQPEDAVIFPEESFELKAKLDISRLRLAELHLAQTGLSALLRISNSNLDLHFLHSNSYIGILFIPVNLARFVLIGKSKGLIYAEPEMHVFF
jgi:hypothetical protein